MSTKKANSLAVFGPFLKEYMVTTEFKQICQKPIPGVYVVPSARSRNVWFGVIFVRSGAYQGGIYRFRVVLSEDYPNMFPRIEFKTPFFHPLVHPDTGELNLSEISTGLRGSPFQVYSVLKYVHRIFRNIKHEDAWNKGAAEMLKNNPERFIEWVESNVELSKQDVFRPTEDDNDPHAIKFSAINDATYQTCVNNLLNSNWD